MASTPDSNGMSWGFTHTPMLFVASNPSKRCFAQFLPDHPNPSSVPDGNVPSLYKRIRVHIFNYVSICARFTKKMSNLPFVDGKIPHYSARMKDKVPQFQSLHPDPDPHPDTASRVLAPSPSPHHHKAAYQVVAIPPSLTKRRVESVFRRRIH